MKILSILALVLTLAACTNPEEGADNTVPRLNLPDYQGRWLVVNYWAEWCKPCIKEIPELNSLDQRYAQIAVLGVNFDGNTGAELETQVEKLGIAFPTLLEDPAAQLGMQKPSVLPTTLVFDPDGRLANTLVGPQTLESLALATGQAAMPEAGPVAEDILPQGQ
ncbi:TlpA family protein disulfide reductase [Pseudohalioglobus sediminis]|uniref:TlpA family protein disulfide reductase n=1 Tax=Pseudohalioglobus sediminis TaxID=2606449 RepID=A0A5B0X0F0_9GAMM|nr:TlpA disulfide reductase family protein [Pseudohalioglobus sediminis]KAA1192834.1 TlpA family protein disulfide reductase [Pseudohalioglobus sediminis]